MSHRNEPARERRRRLLKGDTSLSSLPLYDSKRRNLTLDNHFGWMVVQKCQVGDGNIPRYPQVVQYHEDPDKYGPEYRKLTYVVYLEGKETLGKTEKEIQTSKMVLPTKDVRIIEPVPEVHKVEENYYKANYELPPKNKKPKKEKGRTAPKSWQLRAAAGADTLTVHVTGESVRPYETMEYDSKYDRELKEYYRSWLQRPVTEGRSEKIIETKEDEKERLVRDLKLPREEKQTKEKTPRDDSPSGEKKKRKLVHNFFYKDHDDDRIFRPIAPTQDGPVVVENYTTDYVPGGKKSKMDKGRTVPKSWQLRAGAEHDGPDVLEHCTEYGEHSGKEVAKKEKANNNSWYDNYRVITKGRTEGEVLWDSPSGTNKFLYLPKNWASRTARDRG